jgi:hypothetical protein
MRSRLFTTCFLITFGLFSAEASAQPVRGMSMEIPKDSFELKPDNFGTYGNDIDSLVVAGARFAITLCTDKRSCTTLPEKEPQPPGKRKLLLDLTHPVPNTGATSHGIIEAYAANFGAFWGQDKTKRTRYGEKEGWVIRSVLDIPIDSTILSERVEIRFFLNGRQHILQFGPWVAGQYQTNQGIYNGNGTTRATISRTSENTWILDSGLGSIGRLWDNSTSSKPVDLGLFQFRFFATFTSR